MWVFFWGLVSITQLLHYDKQHPHHGVILDLDVDLDRYKEFNQGDPMIKTWKSHGYDSAWVSKGENTQSLEGNCIKDPANITIVKVFSGHREIGGQARVLKGDLEQSEG